MVPAIICAVAADKVQPRWPWPVLKNTPGIRPARTTGIMFGIIGRSPAQGTTCSVVDAGEVAAHPVDQRLHAVGADVAVEVVEFGGACDAETIGAEPAGDDLGGFVEQAHGRRALRLAAVSSSTVIE